MYKCPNCKQLKSKRDCELCPECKREAAAMEQEPIVSISKNDNLTYHDKSGDHRHGEKAVRA